VHRGVSWYRDERGQVSFYDTDGERWVAWKPGVDAPPRPPGWGGGLARPRWKTGWRIVPVVLTLAIVAVAAFQALRPSGNQTQKEAKASAALLGKCLHRNGTVLGHPSYASKPVSCNSPDAAVKVVRVLAPGSPLCPAGSVGVELPFAGVKLLHIECVEPVRPPG
jgi:hypothetical protein